MLLEVAAVGEAPPTVVTHVGLVTSVGSQVGLEAAALVEAAITDGAGVRLLSRVDQLVAVHVTGVTEGFPTRLTGVRLLSGVDVLVIGERGLVGEAPPTDGAVVRPPLAVLAVVVHVDLQVAVGLEALVADGAGERPFARVLPLVAAQLGRGEDRLLTPEAGERSLVGGLQVLVDVVAAHGFAAGHAAHRFVPGLCAVVGELVLGQGVLLSVGLPTVALKRLLTSVGETVSLEGHVLYKCSPTVVAGVRPLSGVDEDVAFQVPRVPEGLPAVLTLVRLVLSVDRLVSTKVGFQVERFPTGVAGEGANVTVRPLVSQEASSEHEGFPTHVTQVRLLPCM